MRTQIRTLLLAGLITMASSVYAQSGTVVAGSAPGKAGAAQTVEVMATITAINAATREVTLKGPKGNEFPLTAGPEVKNFAQMKVGDQVKAQYVEALTLELKKGSTAPISRVEDNNTAAAQAGERPGAAVGRRITVVAEIVALDAATQRVTLQGPKQAVDLKVADPAQFKLLAKGDRVQATYLQAVAVLVEPVKK